MRPNSCLSSAAAIGERTEFMPAGEQHRLRPRGALGHRAQPFQCSTQISVNSRRAVSKSTVDLALEPLQQELASPRRAARAGPCRSPRCGSGVAVRIAS